MQVVLLLVSPSSWTVINKVYSDPAFLCSRKMASSVVGIDGHIINRYQSEGPKNIDHYENPFCPTTTETSAAAWWWVHQHQWRRRCGCRLRDEGIVKTTRSPPAAAFAYRFQLTVSRRAQAIKNTDITENLPPIESHCYSGEKIKAATVADL